jgi:hypothetical protein
MVSALAAGESGLAHGVAAAWCADGWPGVGCCPHPAVTQARLMIMTAASHDELRKTSLQFLMLDDGLAGPPAVSDVILTRGAGFRFRLFGTSAGDQDHRTLLPEGGAAPARQSLGGHAQ